MNSREQNRKCKGTKRDGTPCKSRSLLQGSDYCRWHQPDAEFSTSTGRYTPSKTRQVQQTLPATLTAPELVRVPAGEFQMGATARRPSISEEPAEGHWHWTGADARRTSRSVEPQHQAYVSEFYIGKYAVTNEQYMAFVRLTGHKSPKHWKAGRIPSAKTNHPVVYVSWDDSVAFCKWLSEQTGKPFRLPTEAEWEMAARGMDGREYPWGDEWDKEKCNSGEPAGGDTTPVGKYSPAGDSPYGCADMAGNAWEWCADWFDEDEYKRRSRRVVKDPQGPESGEDRVVRGGSWVSNPRFARCAYRGRGAPGHFYDLIGFRVVASLPNSKS